MFNKFMVLFLAVMFSSTGLLYAEEEISPQRQAMMDFMDERNDNLAAENAGYQLSAIYYTTLQQGDAHEQNVLLAKNIGNGRLRDGLTAKYLGIHWVYGDPDRGGRTNIVYAIDTTDVAPIDDGLSLEQTIGFLDSAMNSWNNVNCTSLDIDGVLSETDLGLEQNREGFGGSSETPPYDIVFAGNLPQDFFIEIEAPGALAVTFVYTFTGIGREPLKGNDPLDINGDGYLDYAFSEIYSNAEVVWSDGGQRTNLNDYFVGGFATVVQDYETVMLHEAGHGLSIEHFGKSLFDTETGYIESIPKEGIMNAFAKGPAAREVDKRTNGMFCSVWATWPKE